VPDLGEALSSVERMIGNGQRASEVVKRLRALSRKSEPRHAPLAIADVLADAVLLVRRELQVHRVVLDLAVPQSLPAVRGDNVQLQQVVINLVMNGIQAMDAEPAGTRRLRVEVARGTGEQAGSVVVSVADSGRGIASSDLNRLFDAFFTTRPQGMGMGLSICRSIVEAHGGRIWAANGAAGGAVFAFSLPILEEHAS
jgi:signal transduction histidine kinase